jgi:hypothetical protein
VDCVILFIVLIAVHLMISLGVVTLAQENNLLVWLVAAIVVPAMFEARPSAWIAQRRANGQRCFIATKNTACTSLV